MQKETQLLNLGKGNINQRTLIIEMGKKNDSQEESDTVNKLCHLPSSSLFSDWREKAKLRCERIKKLQRG